VARHASTDGTRRGIAAWPIVTAVVVVVLALAVVGYFLIVDDDESTQARCSAQVALPVTADVGSAPAIATAAAAFDATLPVARSTCVTTVVGEIPGPEAARLLAAGWEPPDGPAPAVWVVDDESPLAALEETNSSMTAGRDTDPMAAAPVVLAVRPEDADAVAAVAWSELPAAAGPDGTTLLADGRRLTLALPDPRTNRATSYALQSILAGTVNGAPVTPDAVAAAADELAGVGPGSDTDTPNTTAESLDALAGGGAAFSAVPVLASDLQAYNEAADPGAELLAVHPGGPTVGDRMFVVPLSAAWVDPTLKDAGAAFIAYLRSPAGQQELGSGGLLVIGAPPPPTDSAATGEIPSAEAIVAPAGGAVDAALATALGA
jgi:hypothetical protein